MTDPPRPPVPSPPPPPPEDEPPLNPAWLVGSIIVAKVATLAVVLWLSWTPRTGVLVAAVSWYWLPLIAALVAGPLLVARRMMKARRRRQQLLRSEWMVDERSAKSDSVSSPR